MWVSRLLLWLCASPALAASIWLAPGLELPLPSALPLQVFETELSEKSPVLVGEIAGVAGYFIAASHANTPNTNTVLWKKLETEIRKRSNRGYFISAQRGNFVTLQDDPVWFRSYQYESRGQQHRQLYFLLRRNNTVYWIVLTTTDGVSLELVRPIAEALIRRATLLVQ